MEGFGPVIAAPGHMGVNGEVRVDFVRRRSYRSRRAREALESPSSGTSVGPTASKRSLS